jgi:hypothetical protein
MSEIQPALTPEQWRKQEATDRTWFIEHDGVALWEDGSVTVEEHGPIARHGTAALCLYGQPFGFTQEDVEMLQAVHDTRVAQARAIGVAYGHPQWLRLIERIAALLPPVP